MMLALRSETMDEKKVTVTWDESDGRTRSPMPSVISPGSSTDQFLAWQRGGPGILSFLAFLCVWLRWRAGFGIWLKFFKASSMT